MKESLFSLFHHDIFSTCEAYNVDSEYLFSLTRKQPDKGIRDLANTLLETISKYSIGCSDSEVSLTLTGGMDSRVLLAALLKKGIAPNCLTYGNPDSKDVIFARNITEKLKLKFHNACQKPPDKYWFYDWAVKTIKLDNGNSHFFRAHRTAAIAEHKDLFNPKVLFTGHMGGEGLRGLSYNSYYSSPFFELVNESKMSIEKATIKVLRDYFIEIDKIDIKNVIEKVMQLSWMKHDNKTNKFYFLYDLIAKTHHTQDLRIYKNFVPSVIPVYLQKEYLFTLFSSPYHFLAKKPGFIGSLQNPLVSCKIIESLYPKLLDFPFANGFSPRDYLKGYWYYVPKKALTSRKQKNKFPATFSYGGFFVEFLIDYLKSIDPIIWTIFDNKSYMQALNKNNHMSDEGYWHRFSNPVLFDLVNKIVK